MINSLRPSFKPYDRISRIRLSGAVLSVCFMNISRLHRVVVWWVHIVGEVSHCCNNCSVHASCCAFSTTIVAFAPPRSSAFSRMSVCYFRNDNILTILLVADWPCRRLLSHLCWRYFVWFLRGLPLSSSRTLWDLVLCDSNVYLSTISFSQF